MNIIPNGKILVIDQLSVIKNTMKKSPSTSVNSNKNNATSESERKSIMNNNLAETLKSIGIIGSLKPTSNNSQVKQQQQQPQVSIKKNTKSKQQVEQQQTQYTNSSQNNSKNIVETQSIGCGGSTAAGTKPKNKTNDITSSPSHFAMLNHNKISSFNNRFKQQTAEFKQQYDLIEHKFKQILNNERKCLASTSSSSASSSTSSSTTFLFSKENKETDKNNNSKELVLADKQVVDEDEDEEEEELDEDDDDDDEDEEDNYEYLENENKTTNKKVYIFSNCCKYLISF